MQTGLEGFSLTDFTFRIILSYVTEILVVSLPKDHLTMTNLISPQLKKIAFIKPPVPLKQKYNIARQSISKLYIQV